MSTSLALPAADSRRSGAVGLYVEAALAMVEQEPQMTSWCVSRTGPATFISFISFTDESARQDHLAEELATALGAKADELFVAAPRAIEHEVLAQIRG